MTRQFLPGSAVFLLLAFLLISCDTSPPEPVDGEEVVVAQVGDEVITVGDFRRNYEAGFSHLKTGDSPRLTFLEYMIKEKTLSLEGYRLGLDETQYVQARERELTNELLLDALIRKEIRSKIRVSEKEIEEEINRDKVSFKFRYWFEPTEEKARAVVERMRIEGYAAVVDDLLRSNPERNIKPSFLTTDYLTHQQVTPVVMDAIKDLPYGEISDPVFMNDTWYIYQVLDIRRSAVTTNEYKRQATSVEQVIYYRKLHEGIIAYVGELVGPKNVVTKARAFTLLGNALLEWNDIPEEGRLPFQAAVDQATEAQKHLWNLKTNGGQDFLTFDGGKLSIDEFLLNFDPRNINRGKEQQQDFKVALDEAVAVTIRNHFMIEEANRQNLIRDVDLQAELKRWRDKWVYRAAGIDINGSKRVNSVERVEKMAAAAKNLRDRYPVKIETAVLDTISLIDFRKSRWASTQMYRSGTNRPAYPTVDPDWGRKGKDNEALKH